VGKGFGPRVFQHENEARHPNNRLSNAYKLNVIRSIWRSGFKPIYEIDFTTSEPEKALAREAELIQLYRRLHEGGPLTNLAAGGGSIAGPAPASIERHSATLGGMPDDNPERATLNGFVLSIAHMRSVVVKPSSQLVARPTVRYPSKAMSISQRQAVALIASAAANGIIMDGECRVPRRLAVEGVSGLVENGVACDILTSGTASVESAENPADEYFVLTPAQAKRVTGILGVPKCVDLGVVVDAGVTRRASFHKIESPARDRRIA
jgi:hypothetical protein